MSKQKKVYKQFGRKMKEGVNGNRKLLWKEASNMKEKVDSCSRIKDWKWEVGTRRGRSILKICIM